MKPGSVLRSILRTLNGETWGSGAAATASPTPKSVPSQDLPGLDNKGDALPNTMNQWG
jgi:hypothetical protein